MSGFNGSNGFRALAGRRGHLGAGLLEALAGAAERSPDGPQVWAPWVARSLGLPAAAGLGPATFYADLAAPRGRRHVRVCAAAACFAARAGRQLAEVEEVLGV
ncbi:NAD(P)H-dependent oxidoreductase subunit E, partial [Streptosporangium saharense]|uniref:NAD(P)H-dependent oxidoreductase subunit E n=1 Tax=Streptosporangium saharense TaxID=1706840 RepID=UPI003323841C